MHIPVTKGSNYMLPSNREMRNMLQAAGIPNFSSRVLGDLGNLLSGGRFLSPEEMLPHVEKAVRESQSQRVDLGSFSYVDSVVDNTAEKVQQELTNYIDLLKQVKDMPVENRLDSYMKQAVSIAQTLVASDPEAWESSENSQQNGYGNSRLDGVPSKKKSGDDAVDLAKKIEKLSESEKFLLGEGDGSYLKLAKNVAKKHLMRIGAQMKNLQLGIGKIEYREEDEGENIYYREMTGLDEIADVDLRDLLYPWGKLDLAQNNLLVQKQQKKITGKRGLFALLDASSSMSSTYRQQVAGGVIMCLLEQVVKGEAELFLWFYNTVLDDYVHIVDTPEKAIKLFQKLIHTDYGRGGTDTNSAIMEVIPLVNKLCDSRNLKKPELCVVTDGEDNIHLKVSDLAMLHKFHAFVIQGDNDALTALARAKGGLYFNRL